jgi:hypothetical protein
MAIPASNPGIPNGAANQSFFMNTVSKMAELAKKIGDIALKVLQTLVAIVMIMAISTAMAYFMSGGHPIAIPLGIIGGIWQGILAAQEIWKK